MNDLFEKWFKEFHKSELADHICQPILCQFGCYIETGVDRMKPFLLRAWEAASETNAEGET